MSALKQLQDYGQSVWLDYIRRTLILTGELQRLIDHDGLRGVTSNPAISMPCRVPRSTSVRCATWAR